MKYLASTTLLLCCVTLTAIAARGDDTCIFYPSSDEVPPSIVLYIDNSGEMEEARWHSDFDNTQDWTNGSNEAIDNPATGDAFLNEYGYGISEQGGGGSTSYFLAPFVISSQNVMEMDSSKMVAGVPNAAGDYTWTFNGKSITLPVTSKTDALADFGAPNADPVTAMRYSTNYLNWLFFSGEYSESGAGLVDENRFYTAKQALAKVILATENRAMFSLWYHTNDDGATQNKPLGFALTEDGSGGFDYDPDFLNSINGMQTYDFSPLAEGLAEVAGYYDSANSHGENADCAQNFVIMISSGLSSRDIGDATGGLTASQYEPDFLLDYDADGNEPGEGWLVEDNSHDGLDNNNDGEVDDADERITYEIPTGYNGSTYLDDIAYYLYNNDVGYPEGHQNIVTYTIGFMGDHVSNLFLINTSNNGNGITNLYDTSHPDYGRYHEEASDPDALVDALTNAINSILERTTVFAAPVVPVTRTTSGNRIYMSFFTPRSSSFWEGNVVKFALDANNEIVDANGDPATEPNGALREDAVPFWSTIDWAADPLSTPLPAANGIFYSQRPIFTYLGGDVSITAAENAFTEANITSELLGNPELSVSEVVDFIRGADIFDDDEDGISDENRGVITGDVLHSEPAVYEFIHKEGTLTLSSASSFSAGEQLVGNMGGRATFDEFGVGEGSYEQLLSPFSVGEIVTGAQSGVSATILSLSDPTLIFFGSNDGMLHAVRDVDGSAAWSFIPPNQLARLKLIPEGEGHSYFVDGSPRLYLIDDDGDGVIDTDGDDDNNGSIDSDPDRVILVCGERKGSSSFFALDVSDPEHPQYMWRISPVADTAFAPPILYPDLGESWSEPRFGKLKTYDTDTIGVDALIIGGGYSEDNSAGKSLYILELQSATLLREFVFTEGYSVASAATVLDIDDNGFIDKLYIGDMGGNMFRIGYFLDSSGTQLIFPDSDENINNWQSHLFFWANNGVDITDRKFFYPPSVALERGYDLVFMPTGDRENPCDTTTNDGVFVVKDDHSSILSLTVSDLVNISDPTDITYSVPDLDGEDLGWYYLLAPGEKVLAKGLVFSGTYYFTSFTPNDDPCLPGGIASLYAMLYKTGESDDEFFTNLGTSGPSVAIGGGIPSRPVLVINNDPEDTKLLISVGSTNADDDSSSQGAGIITTAPTDDTSFSYIWWRDWVLP